MKNQNKAAIYHLKSSMKNIVVACLLLLMVSRFAYSLTLKMETICPSEMTG
jgi:hypothetical protein